MYPKLYHVYSVVLAHVSEPFYQVSSGVPPPHLSDQWETRLKYCKMTVDMVLTVRQDVMISPAR